VAEAIAENAAWYCWHASRRQALPSTWEIPSLAKDERPDHPTFAATNLAASMRRWRLTSAVVVDSVADQRSACWACWRGNAAGLGGWTFVTRISLTMLQATGMGFFCLYGSTAALAITLPLAAVINCIGIGFQRATHTRWPLVANDGTGDPTLTDMTTRSPGAVTPSVTARP
jgi:hypothetical protein